MTTIDTTQADAARPSLSTRPTATYGFDLSMALLTLWMVGGAYLDAWAHSHLGSELETFFTPWHAVLYSGFSAVMAFTLFHFMRNILRGHSFRLAMPRGYDLTLLGVGIFMVGGVGDMLWHTAFGIELDIEGALSATHQILEVAIVLLAAGPLRAAWSRPESDLSWRGFFPTALSLALTLCALTLITQIIHPLARLWPVWTVETGRERSAYQVLGLASIMIQTGFLMGLVLLAIKRWGQKLPFGTLSLMFTLNAIALSFMSDQFRLIPAVIVGGLAADVLLRWLRPGPDRIGATRAYAALVPLILYAGYFLTLAITDTIWWRIHTVSGGLTGAAAVGVLLSVLVFPPPDSESDT